MRLVRMIDFWAKHKPEASAIMMLDSVISYQALSRAIRSVAGHLSRQIVDATAPVGILIDHPPRNIVVNLALMSLGVPSIVIRDTQRDHLKSVGAKLLLYDGPAGLIPGLSIVRIEQGWFGDGNPPQPAAPREPRPAARTKLAFTSGTTGIPKAISFSDDDIAARSNFLRTVTGDVQWTRSLILPGLSTNFAFSQVALALESGRAISFASVPEEYSRLIELFGIELLVCSNQQAQSLVDHLQTKKQRLRSLKCVWIGGDVITENLAQKVGDYLCRDIIGVYASTEAHVAAFGRWEAIKQTPRAVGYVCPWATVESVNEKGAVLAPGQEGDIRIRTPNQGLHYSPGPEADEQIETWFYPGDRGTITPDGLLVISGRATDTINKGGVKVSAAIVDQCLAALPGIEDAAVCSLPGSNGVDELVAAVVSKSAVDLPGFNAALTRAGVEATIDRYVLVDRIPRNATGKVNRDEIKALVRSRSAS